MYFLLVFRDRWWVSDQIRLRVFQVLLVFHIEVNLWDFTSEDFCILRVLTNIQLVCIQLFETLSCGLVEQCRWVTQSSTIDKGWSTTTTEYASVCERFCVWILSWSNLAWRICPELLLLHCWNCSYLWRSIVFFILGHHIEVKSFPSLLLHFEFERAYYIIYLFILFNILNRLEQ